MNSELLITAICLLIMLALIGVFARYVVGRSKPLDNEYFADRWQEAQALCKDKETWPLAIINADKLLDEALKKSRFRGKTMGERLVAAQRSLSDNDSAWFGHKLRNKLVHEQNISLRQTDVRNALKGIRQALRDLGALNK